MSSGFRLPSDIADQLCVVIRENHPNVILVDPVVQHLHDISEVLQSQFHLASVDLGAGLSEVLVGLPPDVRTRQAPIWISDTLRALQPGPIVCDNIDLLFEPSLRLDPLRMFQQCSHITRLVVLWPGEHSKGVLSYAVPQHGHYRYWTHPEACILTPFASVRSST